MAKLSDVETQRDIRDVASRLLGSAAPDIIAEELSSFTSTRIHLSAPPEELVDSVRKWIANSEVVEDEE